jgi:Mrp family chromosome partitioning ATPase/capsular polysaccharide biosynthesis protein
MSNGGQSSSPAPEYAADELSLSDYLAVLRRQWLVAVGIAVVVVGAALAYSLLTPPRYEAESTVLLRTGNSQSLFSRPPGNSSFQLVRTTASELEFARSDALSARTGQLPADYTLSVDRSDDLQSDTLIFKVEGPDQAEVARLATTYADAYVAVRDGQVEADIGATLAGIDASIAELSLQRDEIREPLEPLETALARATDPDVISRLTTQRLTLLQTLNDDLAPITSQLSILNNDRSGLVVLSQFLSQNESVGARVLTSPDSGRLVGPFLVRNMVLAAVVGAILAFASALLVENLRDRINTIADIERAVPGRPILAVLPDVGDKIGAPISWATIESLPAYRSGLETLITSLQFAVQGQPLASVLVTAASSDSGKSTLAASLALAAQNAGADTFLVEGDLHLPDLEHYLGVERSAGITDVVTGRATLDQALVKPPGSGSLQLLGAGSVDIAAADTWRAATETNLIDKLVQRAGLVVFDSPPVLSVADALVLGTETDVTILAARRKVTKASDLASAANRLEWAGIRVAGIVFIGGPVDDYYGKTK